MFNAGCLAGLEAGNACRDGIQLALKRSQEYLQKLAVGASPRNSGRCRIVAEN
jgi:hypothetical protein